MSNDEIPKFMDDAPVRSTSIVKTSKEAKSIVKSLFGDQPSNRMRYICIACGWDKTLEFDDDEMAALGGDLTDYTGPCAKCECMMLVPHDSVLAGTNIAESALANFNKQVDDASDLVLDKVEARIVGFMGGGGGAAGAPKTASREDLPDANTVETPKKP